MVQVSVTDYRVKSVEHASVELIHVRPSDELQTVSSDGTKNYTEYKPLRTPVRELNILWFIPYYGYIYTVYN